MAPTSARGARSSWWSLAQGLRERLHIVVHGVDVAARPFHPAHRGRHRDNLGAGLIADARSQLGVAPGNRHDDLDPLVLDELDDLGDVSRRRGNAGALLYAGGLDQPE